jgi:ABC-type transporter Mla subunit MlaD
VAVAERKPTPRISSNEIKAGVFLTFCFALFIAMLFVLGHFGHSLRGRQLVDVIFSQVNALRPEAPVMYNGMSIGRVQNVAIVRVDAAMLSRFPALGRHDIPNLPLSDSERSKLNSLPDDQLDAAARAMIQNRTMVLLSLDLLSENDSQRFRVDDEYRIDASMMGDSSVEIRSGTGKAIPPSYKNFIVGVGGDMYTDLGKSLSQVKDILASMAEMAGGDATKRNIQGQLNNFDLFTSNFDEMSAAMVEKLPQTWDSIDTRMVTTKYSLQSFEEQIKSLKPKMDDSLGRAEKAIADLRKNAVESLKGGHDSIVDYRKNALDNIKEFKTSVAEYKDTIPQQIHDAREWSDRFQPTVEKIDNLCSRADDQLDKGIDSLRETLRGYLMTGTELEGATYKIKTWPSSFSHPPDTDEKALYFEVMWQRELARRHYREIRKVLDETRRSLNASGAADQSRLSHIDQILRDSDADFPPVSAEEPAPATGRRK